MSLTPSIGDDDEEDDAPSRDSVSYLKSNLSLNLTKNVLYAFRNVERLGQAWVGVGVGVCPMTPKNR